MSEEKGTGAELLLEAIEETDEETQKEVIEEYKKRVGLNTDESPNEEMQKLQEHLDGEFVPYSIDLMARETLLELLKICEHHGISQQGLLEEMRQGLDPEKDTGEVGVGKGKEVIDLDLEEIAMRGEKRLQLETGKNLDDHARKLVKHHLEF
jgi:hypothetical protein